MDQQKSTSGSVAGGDNSANYENSCVVCFRDVEIYSVGECDHPVCYECSTRMRVLCDQNECPFCRQDVAKVIFTRKKLPYRQLDTSVHSGLYDKRYRICFADLMVQDAFYKLLANPCPKCDDHRTFVSFELLKKHVSRDHERFYCDLCTDNLKIFACERRCYTRSELALHKRKGDVDDTSHRGHPLCEYCDVRYLDRDELFRHLRREHYFCHFCDADGSNHFYADYPSLRDHFHQEHFVCDEGDCAQEQFTGVFRSEIDLRAHKAKQHSSGLGKIAAKQARTLEVEFSLVPRNANNNRLGNGHPGGGGNSGNGGNGGGGAAAAERSEYGYNNRRRETNATEMPVQRPRQIIVSNNEEDFPSLDGGASASTAKGTAQSATNNVSIRAKAFKGAGSFSRTNENFPLLSGGSGGPMQSTAPANHVHQTAGYNKKVSASAVLRTQPQAAASSSASGVIKGAAVIHISNRPKSAAKANDLFDFPALGGAGGRHHNPTALLASSELNPNAVQINKNALSSKHRSLVDEYTIASAVAQKAGSKLGLVSAAAASPTTTTAPKQAQAKLKLQSEENFPSLSGGGGPSVVQAKGPSWVTNGGNRGGGPNNTKVESRKAKVAPAPNWTESTKKEKKQKSNAESKSTTTTKVTTTTTTNSSSNNTTKSKVGKEATTNNNNSNNNNASNSKNNKENKANADYPSLTKTHPLPGFQRATTQTTTTPVKTPPPGFNVTLNSVARPPKNALTFTNSTGEKYNILPNRQYVPPPDMEKRNQILVKHFQSTFKHKEALDEFRKFSQMFREGTYKARPYYEHCQSVLEDQFDAIFPELLALLPDISKQQELYLVHCQQQKNKKSEQLLSVCGTCKQVLTLGDVGTHVQSHAMEQNFPKLKK